MAKKAPAPLLSLSASSASRWLNCPGSAKLCTTVPKKDSFWSNEGNTAHNLLETCIKELAQPMAYRDKEDEEFKLPYTSEMCTAVYVALDYAWSNTDDPHPEEQVMIPWCDQPGKQQTGYVDMWWLEGRTLVVADYKHGAGVSVTPKENDQAMLYAAALIRKHYKLMKEARVNKVRIVILQPRCRDNEPIQDWETTPKELLTFIHTRIIPGVAKAQEDDAPRVPGEKQCQFCDAKAVCPEFADAALQEVIGEYADLLEHDVDTPLPLPSDLDHLERAYRRLPLLYKWAKAVTARMHQTPPPGWKFVDGRSNRKVNDEKAADLKDFLKSCDVPLSSYAPRKIVGIGDLTALISEATDCKKKEAEALLAPYLIKPKPKSILVPPEDNRPPSLDTLVDYEDLFEESE